jgi:enoyl-CoA hydratase/carnithine racemase
MGEALWWSAADAHRATADPGWTDALLDVPMLVIDLRDNDEDYGEPPGLRRAPCPVIAVVSGEDRTLWSTDLLLDEGTPDVALLGSNVDEAAAALAARAAANPTAAATLARVLRVTAELAVDAALEVESLAYSMLLAGPEFRRWLEQASPAKSAADETDAVLCERQGGVLHVILNRPQVHNAFNAAMRDALAEAFTVALMDYGIGTVEMSGNGPSFCSGGDLAEFGTTEDPVRAHLIRTGRSVGAVMHQLQDRLTVRVHGSCIGAGVELPAFARRVVAGDRTTFRLPEVGMGLIPGAGGTVSLPRRIGAERTLLLALSGVDLPVTEAERWGLVDSIVG